MSVGKVCCFFKGVIRNTSVSMAVQRANRAQVISSRASSV